MLGRFVYKVGGLALGSEEMKRHPSFNRREEDGSGQRLVNLVLYRKERHSPKIQSNYRGSLIFSVRKSLA